MKKPDPHPDTKALAGAPGASDDIRLPEPMTDGPCVCPMVQLVDLLSGKWSLPVIYRLILMDRAVRFGELQRAIGRITQKELTKHLREFETLGLVTRTVYAEVPPRVEYRITEYGRTLQTPLDALARWSQTSGQALLRARNDAKCAAVKARSLQSVER